jgi:hypothetical protein
VEGARVLNKLFLHDPENCKFKQVKSIFLFSTHFQKTKKFQYFNTMHGVTGSHHDEGGGKQSVGLHDD